MGPPALRPETRPQSAISDTRRRVFGATWRCCAGIRRWDAPRRRRISALGVASSRSTLPRVIGRRTKRLHSRRTAAIYERVGVIVIEGAAYWEGAAAMTGLLHVLDPLASDAGVGALVFDAFAQFDARPIRKGHDPRIYKAIGVTSHTRLIKEGRYVTATQDGDAINLKPWRPHAPGGWCTEEGDPVIDLDTATPAELGAGVRAAARLADSFYRG